MIAPLRLVLPLAWRWPCMPQAARTAQLTLDMIQNAHRYRGVTDDPAALDEIAIRVANTLVPVGRARLLDIGAGVGTYLERFGAAHRFANEPIDALWTALTTRMPDVQRIGGDAYALLAPSACFDVVTVFHTLHHLADRPRAFAEWARVLAPGGRLILCEPRHTWRRAARLAKHWATEYVWTVDPLRYATHDFCTRREVRALCAGAGLRIVTEWTLPEHVVIVADA